MPTDTTNTNEVRSQGSLGCGSLLASYCGSDDCINDEPLVVAVSLSDKSCNSEVHGNEEDLPHCNADDPLQQGRFASTRKVFRRNAEDLPPQRGRNPSATQKSTDTNKEQFQHNEDLNLNKNSNVII